MTLMDQLTRRQKAVYVFIRDKIRGRGYGPTVREIGQNFGISSPNGVMCHLRTGKKRVDHTGTQHVAGDTVVHGTCGRVRITVSG